jgi:hypothetical protein
MGPSMVVSFQLQLCKWTQSIVYVGVFDFCAPRWILVHAILQVDLTIALLFHFFEAKT